MSKLYLMHEFVRDLITEWRRLKLPMTGKTIVAAVSGGADSVSLLLALDDLVRTGKLKHRIVAAHFNHKLRGEASEADEEYVRKLTTELGIEFAVHGRKIEEEGNLEQNARIARYAFLADTAERLNAFAILTGHTINDQAETFLLNLIRGSGHDGLSAMRPVSPIKGTPVLLIRPMLKWAKRRATEGYCNDRGVSYCYDTMNEDTAFKRVRIRKILLPLLEDMNPNIIETLAQTATLMQVGLPVSLVPASIADNTEIELRKLRSMPQATLYATIREWIKTFRGSTRQLQLKHIQSVERLIHSTKSGKTAELPGNARIVKSGGKLRYEENAVENWESAN